MSNQESKQQQNDDTPDVGAALVGSGDLLASAERMVDRTEMILSAELFLLRRVAETSSDVVKAEHWEELREACGGMEPLRAEHAAAVGAYEKWLSEGEG